MYRYLCRDGANTSIVCVQRAIVSGRAGGTMTLSIFDEDNSYVLSNLLSTVARKQHAVLNMNDVRG